MKKSLSIFFAFIILFSIMGFTVAVHYCGGNVAQVKVVIGDEKASCGMETCVMENGQELCNNSTHFTKNCCKDKLYRVQLKDDYLKTFIQKLNLSNTFIAPFSIFSQAIPSHFPGISLIRNHSPPLLSNQSISILFQVFRL
ncbi:MAG: hypothetical protein ABII90_07505 [Bacteroidota bacterium]